MTGGTVELDGGQVDTLVALVEEGPLWDGNVPSKRARDELIERGLAVRVMVKGGDGHTAATYAGRDAYKARFPDLDGAIPDTVAQAKVNRATRRTLLGMRSLR